MKFLFLFTVIIIAACDAKPRTKSCNDVRRGKFGFWGNDTGRKYFIERNDSVQIETDDMSGAVIKFYIKWPSPCEYELVFSKFIKKGADSLNYKINPGTIRTKIIEINSEYYIFKTTIDGYDFELTDTMGISRQF